MLELHFEANYYFRYSFPKDLPADSQEDIDSSIQSFCACLYSPLRYSRLNWCCKFFA